MPPFLAYHASPNQITAFDLRAVGSGSGAQAQGFGIYFAEALDVVRTYRMPQGCAAHQRLIGEGDAIQKEGEQMGLRMAYDFDDHQEYFYGGNVPPDLQHRLSEYNRAFRGHIYEVRLEVDRNHLLLWDQPCRLQPEPVLIGFQSAALESTEMARALAGALDRAVDGAGLYRALALASGEAKGSDREWANSPAARHVSDFLLRAGIDGVAYLDGYSRLSGQGTSNFVIFDPSKAMIVREL